MLNELATILIPYAQGLRINTNDRLDDKCILLIELATDVYSAFGEHDDKQNALIEISVFENHDKAQEIINDIFKGISNSYHETNGYHFTFMYPDSTPSNREVEDGLTWQYYFTVVCTTIKK